MSRPISNSKTRIPNLERQNREKRDKTYVSSDDIKKIKTEIEASILAENAKIELNYNKAVESYKDVKDGQVKEFEKETKKLVDETLVKDFNQIDNKYRDTYLELANNLVKDSKMSTKQKTDIFNLLSVLDERIKNKMYQKKLVNFDDISKTAAVIPNNLSTAEQDHIRFNPDYSAATLSDTVELPRDKEILLGVLEELPVEYRSSSIENSDIGAFIMQMKLRGNNIAIDLYLTNTLLTDNKYGTAVVSESSYNMDNALMVCVYKEKNTNKVYFTLKNAEYEKIRETLILTTSYNVLLGGKFALPDEMGMLFIPDENKYKRIGDGIIKGNEEGIVGPVNNVLIERDFYNNILQHIGLSESNVFGETVKVRINSIAKEIENADVNVIESRFNTTKDLRKAIENDPIIIDEDEILQVVDSEEDGRFIDNEPYKTYYDKVTKTLYIGSNWGLFAYNFTTQKTKNYTDIPKPVNKIKFDVKDNTLDVATDKGFFRIHNLGSDSERIEKKDLDFKVWNGTMNFWGNYKEQYPYDELGIELPDDPLELPPLTPEIENFKQPTYQSDDVYMNMLRIVKGHADKFYHKCENYQVKDFMHVTTDLKAANMIKKMFPNFKTLRAKTPEEIAATPNIKDIQWVFGFRNGPPKNDAPKGYPWPYNYENIEVATIIDSSDLAIRKFPDKEWTIIPAMDQNCTYKPISCGVWSYNHSTKDAKGLLATITSTNKIFISNDIYSWREATLPEDTRGNVWEDIKWIPNWIPSNFSSTYDTNNCLGTWMAISSSGIADKRVIISVDGENWEVLSGLPSQINDHEWKFIVPNLYTKDELIPIHKYREEMQAFPMGVTASDLPRIKDEYVRAAFEIITDKIAGGAVSIYCQKSNGAYAFNSSFTFSESMAGSITEEKGKFNKITKLSANVGYSYRYKFIDTSSVDRIGFTDKIEYQTYQNVEIEVSSELNGEIHLFKVTSGFSDISITEKNRLSDAEQYMSSIFKDYTGGVDPNLEPNPDFYWDNFVSPENIRIIKHIPMVERITNAITLRKTMIFEKKIEGFDSKISVSYDGGKFLTSLNRRGFILDGSSFELNPEGSKHDSISKTMAAVDILNRSEDFVQSGVLGGSLNNYDIELKQDAMASAAIDLRNNVNIVYYDDHFHIYCKTRESVNSPWVEYHMITDDTIEHEIDGPETKNKVSENYLFNVIVDRYVNDKGQGTQEKTFVYREAYIYDVDSEGRKGELTKTVKQLIGSSHIVEFFHYLTNKDTTYDKWPFEVTDGKDVEIILKGDGEPTLFNYLTTVMKDLFFSNYEIPLGRLVKYSTRYGHDVYFNEIESCDETPTSLNTKNIAFIPYRRNGRRNFAIVVGRADKNPYPRQAKEKNYLEMGQIILTDFNEYAPDMDSYPYSYMDERHFDYVYSRDTMNIRNTALHMCDSYPDYDPENQYIYDRRNSIVHVLRETPVKTEYVGRRYLRGNDSIMTNFVHIPHLNGYIFGDNYNWFYREAANHEEFLNHKNILHGEDKLGYAGNIVVLTDLDGTNTLVKIDNESNTMVVLDRYETYTQMNNEWENIAFPHPYKKNCQDTDGITLYKALEAAGVPYDVPCKCSGYVIINGRKYSIAQVYITEPYDTIENEYRPGEFVSYGCLQLLFDPNSKFDHVFGLSNTVDRYNNDVFDSNYRSSIEGESNTVGVFPGIRMGSFDRIHNFRGGGNNSRVATENPLINSWISAYNTYSYWTLDDSYNNYFTPDCVNDTFCMKSAIQIKNKIFVPMYNHNKLYVYDADTNIWSQCNISWEKIHESYTGFAQASQLMAYDINSEIIYTIVRRKTTVNEVAEVTECLAYSTDEGVTWNETPLSPSINPIGFYIKDNNAHVICDEALVKHKITGVEMSKNEYNFDIETGDYVVEENYGNSITLVNKRVAINNDQYTEVFFKDWEDPTSRYLHKEENTEPTVWTKLLNGDNIYCELDHGQKSLVRKTEWGTTDERGFTDQIRIIYKGPRYEKILISNDGEPEKYGIAEYSVFSVYSRDMINVLDRYENYSGIYIGDRRVKELPYNHGYDQKFVMSPKANDEAFRTYAKKYDVISTIIVYSKGSANYLISHDNGDNWTELVAPEPINSIYYTSNGLGIIMVPSDKEVGDKVIYVSLSYGDEFNYKIKTNNQYLFNGIMMKNTNNFLIFPSEKNNIYLNVPISISEDIVEESILPLNYKVDELYYFNNSENNTILLINKDNDSTLEKLLMSEDSGDLFKVRMNDSEYQSLINMKSIETDPSDGVMKRRILQWNRKIYKLKEIWLDPNSNGKITLERTGYISFPTVIGNSDTNITGMKIKKYFYDERINKWVVLTNVYNNSTIFVILSNDFFTENPREWIIYQYNMSSGSENNSNYSFDCDVFYSKNLDRNILYFQESNTGRTAFTSYRFLDVNYTQENFKNPGPHRYSGKIFSFYDDPITGKVWLLRADTGRVGSVTDGNLSSIGGSLPNELECDPRKEYIIKSWAVMETAYNDYVPNYYYNNGDNERCGWFPVNIPEYGYNGKHNCFICMHTFGAFVFRMIKKYKYYNGVEYNIDKVKIERKWANYHEGSESFGSTNLGFVSPRGWNSTKQIFTQGFDLTIMFSKRKMIKNIVETI